MKIPVTDTREGARFAVRVTPRASRTAITGVHGEGAQAALKIALHAPPVEGRANDALIEFLADLFSVRRADIEIASGHHARTKVVMIRGKSAAAIATAIQMES